VAAVAGIFLVAVVPDIVNFSEPTKKILDPPDLKNIFSLKPSPKFIVAAIFALSPVYLFDRLRQTDKLLSNLRSTQLANR
jgi:hypothetical protein